MVILFIMDKRWLLSIRGAPPRLAAIALGLAPVALLAALWFFLTTGPVEERAVGPSILPSPGEVFQSVPLLFTEREVVRHLLASLRRVGLAFLLALGVTLPLGVLMGAFGSVRATFAPLATAGGYIPIATLVPLTMSWFGTGEVQKVVFLAMAFAIYLLPLVYSAIDAVPEVYLRTAATLGASRWQMVWGVLVPVALPDIWRSMRLAFGVGWTYLVLAEVVVMTDGLGFLVGMSQRRGPREHIYLVIALIAVIAWASDLVWDRSGRLLFPYRRAGR
jgi:NitT/TauT family transport system permease protein